MGEGLDALYHQKIKSAKVDVSTEGKHDIAYKFFDETKQYSIIEKELKAFEIIKSKCVNVGYLNAVWRYNAKVEYNDDLVITTDTIKQLACGNFPEIKHLTQEEYELLKEVLL